MNWKIKINECLTRNIAQRKEKKKRKLKENQIEKKAKVKFNVSCCLIEI